MVVFTTASGLIPEYQKFTNMCIAIKDKQLQQGLNAPASASLKAPLLGFEKLLIANGSKGCSSSVSEPLHQNELLLTCEMDLEGTPPSFLPNNELRLDSATSKSASAVAHGSQSSYFFDPTGEDKDSIKDEARDGTRDSRQHATDWRADGSRRSAKLTARDSGRISSRISKTPTEPKSDKKKQGKPEVKAEDQVKVDEVGIVHKIIAKCWCPED
jgi:hypothetical protein